MQKNKASGYTTVIHGLISAGIFLFLTGCASLPKYPHPSAINSSELASIKIETSKSISGATMEAGEHKVDVAAQMALQNVSAEPALWYKIGGLSKHASASISFDDKFGVEIAGDWQDCTGSLKSKTCYFNDKANFFIPAGKYNVTLNLVVDEGGKFPHYRLHKKPAGTFTFEKDKKYTMYLGAFDINFAAFGGRAAPQVFITGIKETKIR